MSALSLSPLCAVRSTQSVSRNWSAVRILRGEPECVMSLSVRSNTLQHSPDSRLPNSPDKQARGYEGGEKKREAIWYRMPYLQLLITSNNR